MSRVVVSLTTMPDRMDGLVRYVIPSLLAQTRKPDEIALNIPLKCARYDRGYDVPKWLENAVTVHRVDRDYGPATKLLPTLLRERDPDTQIVTVDDDVVYSKDVVERLTKPDCKDAVTGIMGTIFRMTKQHCFIHSENEYEGSLVDVDLLGGYRGICYRRGLIDEDIFADFDAVCELAGKLLLDDDPFFAHYFRRKGIKRYVVGGTPKNENGVYGFLNFQNVLVPAGSGIFWDAEGVTNRDMEPFSQAMFRHFCPEDYQRDLDAAWYHVRGDDWYYGRGRRVDYRRALETWMEGSHRGNRQCFANLVWALNKGIGLYEKGTAKSVSVSLIDEVAEMSYVEKCMFIDNLAAKLNEKERDALANILREANESPT
jgi:hypothetical protein